MAASKIIDGNNNDAAIMVDDDAALQRYGVVINQYVLPNSDSVNMILIVFASANGMT